MSDQRDFYQTQYKELADLPGLGPASIAKLEEIGYKTVKSLATAHWRELITEGIAEDTAKKVIKAAQKVLDIGFVSGVELMELRANRVKLTTGCTGLDELLEGGIETESITEFYAEFGAGKSQICHQLAVTVQLPVEQGGLGGKVLYIDTEQVFRPKRCIEIAARFDHFKEDPKKVLNGIIFAEAYTSAHQMILLEAADEIIKDNNVKLIVIDALMSHFRSEYIGRAMLAERQQQVSKHLHKLTRLLRAFECAAVIANQVTATPDSYSNFEPKAIGGNIVGHTVHTRLYIRKVRPPGRIIKIVASPFLPDGEVPVIITEKGIISADQEDTDAG